MRVRRDRQTHYAQFKNELAAAVPLFCVRPALACGLRIRALNRAGDYACVLVPKKDHWPQWARFVEAGKVFGIYPNQLEHLVERAEKRMKRQGLKHHDALRGTY